MDVLSTKYKEHRDEVLHALDVNKELLSLLTREGLLDIADCVKYQGIADKKKRTQALMKTLTERRTDRAYGILIQCLREAGLGKAADLLTDIGEETQIIAQLQKQLDDQIEALNDYLDKEEKRAKVPKEKPGCGHIRKKVKPGAATSDKEVWKSVQESMRRAVDQLERCKAVITKVHSDCQQVAQTNAELMSQTRDCYLELSKMIRPSTKSASEIQTSTRTTQELFQLLIDDVHRLMTRKSKAFASENESRTSAMRILRQLRDWIVDRSTVLNTLHSTFSPVANPRFSVSRHSSSESRGQYLKTFKSNPDQNFTSQERSSSSHVPSPPAIMDNSQGHVADPNGSFSHDHLVPPPFATSTPQPSEPHSMETPQSTEVQIQPISSVVEGVHQLESQLREYIHLEIMLTDKYRFEMRLKQNQKKALGFSSKGIDDAKSIVNHLSTSGSAEMDGLHKLRGQLDRISQEYNECSKYMDKVAASMAQIDDVEMFLKNVYQRELEYQKWKKKSETNKENDKKKGKSKVTEGRGSKSKEKYRKDPYESLVELFQQGNQFQQNHSQDAMNRTTRDKHSAMTLSNQKLFLPRITRSHDAIPGIPPSDDLLAKLKLLVANYEIVRLRMLTMEDRFRREVARRERKAEGAIRARDDELFRLQTLLRETEAEKEKFQRLYDNTKIGTSRKK